MPDPGVLGGLVAFGCLVFGSIGGIAWKIRRDSAEVLDDVGDMRTVPLVRIGEARDEQMVRFAGRVVVDDVEIPMAPVSGRPCVAWQLSITAPWKLGRDVILERNGCSSFLIDDGSGRARVVGNPKVWALATRLEGQGSGDDVPPTLAAWLEENHASDEWRDLPELRWSETRVEPGDELAVVGIAHVRIDVDGDSAGYRDAPMLITVEDSDDAPLSLGDDASLRSS
jgi:hypothetical protein